MSIALILRPAFPTLSILGGAGILAALAVFAWLRSHSRAWRWSVAILAMRLMSIAAISLLLLGPSHEHEVPKPQGDSKLMLLLDTSESMRVADCGERSRIAHAVQEVLDPAHLAELDKDFEIDLQGFDAALHPLSLDVVRAEPDAQASGRNTSLSESVTAALNRMSGNGDAMLVVSDGRDTGDNSVQPAAVLAASKGIPVFTMAVGGAASTVDAALMAIPMQDSLLPNETGGLMIRIYQSGLNGRRGVIRVRQGMQEEQIPVSFGDSSVVELQAPIRQADPGQYEYLVSLDGLQDETELANNEQRVFVQVMKRRLRVLVLEGQPFWDTKFLVQSLRKDEQIEIVQLTQVGVRRQEILVTRDTSQAPRLPSTPEDWSRFDVVIVGRGLEHLLDEAGGRGLAQFVENGGNLVFARGLPYDPAFAGGERLRRALVAVEPVAWSDDVESDAAIALTTSGRTGSWLAPSKMQVNADDAFARLPRLETLEHVTSLKPATIVLVAAGEEGAEERPAIVRMSSGRGNVVAILGEGTWKWSLLSPEVEDLRGFYDQFWSNLVRWMALGGDFPPGQQTSLQLSRSSVRLGDEMTVDVVYRFAPDGLTEPQVQVVDANERTLEVAMHRLPGPSPRFRGTLTPQTAGVYRITAATPGMTPPQLEAKFSVYDVNMERLHTAADPIALAMLSDLSGGAALEVQSASDLAGHLARHRQSVLAPPRIEYVWDQSFVMWTLLGWLGLEWIARRLAGLW